MKKAIIIGASSGLGHEVAKILLNDGWRIGIAARRFDLLQQLKLLAPEQVEVLAIDVNASDAPLQLRKLIAMVGGVDLFFMSSGVGKRNIALEEDIELSTVETNALGFVRMVDEAFRYMAENGGGHIAAISSIAGTKGLGAAPAYSATKAFQNTYLQSLEQLAAMRNLDIRFTDIRPGFVATPLLGNDAHYPLLMKPEFVARCAVKAVYSHRHKVVIDWRWSIVTLLWHMIPDFIWRKMNVR